MVNLQQRKVKYSTSMKPTFKICLSKLNQNILFGMYFYYMHTILIIFRKINQKSCENFAHAWMGKFCPNRGQFSPIVELWVKFAHASISFHDFKF